MRIYRFAWSALVLASLLLYTPDAAAQSGITFSFDNVEAVGDAISFDVLARSDEAGARLGDTQIYLGYNASSFGTRVVKGDRISATLGGTLAGSGAYGNPIINDNDDSRVSLTAPFVGSSDEGISLSSNAVVLLRVTMEPVSSDNQGEVSFYEPLMEGQQYASDLETAFAGVTTDGLLEVDLSGLLSGMVAGKSGANTEQLEMTEQFLLDPVYPNPFNPQATVRFAVKEAEAVRVELYNALGQRVAVLFEGTPAAKTYHEVTIDGSGLAGGLYLVRLQGETFGSTRQVALLK